MKRTIPIGPRVPRRDNPLSRALAWLVLTLTGWRVTGEFPDVPRAVVIGAPHTSNWDGLFGVSAILVLGLRLRFMGKHTLFEGPFGWFVRWVGGVPINRESAEGVVEQSVRKLRTEEQFLLGITPEGTREGAQSWKSGFYRIAREAGVPVVIVAFDFGRRRIHVADTLYPGNDEAADMKRILGNYRGVVPRRPERLSAPLRELADGAQNYAE